MKTVVLFSGGLDSTVLLTATVDQEGTDDAMALSLQYGQRHAGELLHAAAIAAKLGVRHEIVDVTPALAAAFAASGSALVTPAIDVPLGHYEDESMRVTVVPNRNMILLAIAVAYAIAYRAGRVAYGAHAGDHAIYPDCRPAFVRAMQAAVAVCNEPPVTLLAPFVEIAKASIVRLGAGIGAPLDLSYSCYQGGPVHCGACGTCVERREAFVAAGVPDPTEYQCSA